MWQIEVWAEKKVLKKFVFCISRKILVGVYEQLESPLNVRGRQRFSVSLYGHSLFGKKLRFACWKGKC